MNRQAQGILMQFKERLESRLDADLVSIICFGSYARNEETPESDLDVLVVVARKNKMVEDLVREQAYAVMWDHDFKPLLSVKIFSAEEWGQLGQLGTSFYEGLQTEGIGV
jgi:predicted nucleotidyltransferase